MYSGDPTFQVNQKIFEALQGATGLTDLVGSRIWDYVPDNEIFPYLKVGPFTFKDHGSHTTLGFDADLTFSVFSQYHGTLECDQIIEQLDLILERKGISITGLGLVTCYRNF